MVKVIHMVFFIIWPKIIANTFTKKGISTRLDISYNLHSIN
jgi:hypothetical protein